MYAYGDATPYLDEALVMRTAEAVEPVNPGISPCSLSTSTKPSSFIKKFSAKEKKYLEASKMLVDTMPNGDPLIGRCYYVPSTEHGQPS